MAQVSSDLLLAAALKSDSQDSPPAYLRLARQQLPSLPMMWLA